MTTSVPLSLACNCSLALSNSIPYTVPSGARSTLRASLTQVEIRRRLDVALPGEVPKIGPAADGWASGRVDLLRNQLIDNAPGYGGSPGARVPAWRGPYLTAPPDADPWQNWYMVNVGVAVGRGAPPVSVRMRSSSFLLVRTASWKRRIGRPLSSFARVGMASS